MSDNLTIFNFEEQPVRTLLIEDEVWFVGKDVAQILGYSKARNAISAHVDPEDKKDAPIQGTLGGTQKMTIINESGVYSLVMSSKLPNAKQFKRWVTSEVLPSIRKTGGYHLEKPDSYMITDPIERAKRWIEEEEVRLALEAKVEEDRPKVECYETFLDTSGLTNFRKSAHLLGIPEQTFMNALRAGKYVYYDASETLLPYAPWKKKGYFEVKKVGRHNGKIREQTFLTPEGLSYFASKFKHLRTTGVLENKSITVSFLSSEEV